MNGIIIGGPAHGETRDPEKCGPVLVVPKRTRVAPRYLDHDVDPMKAKPICDQVEYRLHDFHSTDGKERFRYRVWMPADVLPHQAFEYLIRTALRAPAQ